MNGSRGRRAGGWSLAALIVVIASGCGEMAGPGAAQRYTGILQLETVTGAVTTSSDARHRDETVTWNVDPGADEVITPPRVIEVPAVVKAGEPFTVTVYTIGQSGCWSAESVEFQLSDRLVEVVPYDLHSGAEICTMILAYLRHDLTLTLEEPGEWVIRVNGRRARYGDNVWETPVAAETSVLVEP